MSHSILLLQLNAMIVMNPTGATLPNVTIVLDLLNPEQDGARSLRAKCKSSSVDKGQNPESILIGSQLSAKTPACRLVTIYKKCFCHINEKTVFAHQNNSFS